jgi:dihydrofolate reductase
MRKLIMWNLFTLDGFFEGEKNWDLGFHELVWGQELEDFSNEQLTTGDMLVFGEATYKGMADYWRQEKGKIAEQMNSIRKVVCSATRQTADWNNTTIVRDAVAELPKLKQQGDGNMFVFGSAILSESLMKSGLFDEYRLLIAPILLGNGRRLFNPGLNRLKLQLLEARTISSGGVILRYAPASTG